MPDYIILARDSHGQFHKIITQDRARAIRYSALFQSNELEWSQVEVQVGRERYFGQRSGRNSLKHNGGYNEFLDKPRTL